MTIWKQLTAAPVFFCLMIVALVLAQPTQAAEVTLTAGSDWASGTSAQVNSTIKEGDLQLEPLGSWGAQSWKTPDKTIGVGSAFASDGNYIYVIRGYADVTFWRYAPNTNTWETLPNLPRGAYYGADLQYFDGSLYAIFGGYQKTFARYIIATETWEELSDLPNFPWQGASMTSDGTSIYAIPGNTTQEFYRYNPVTDVWTTLASAPNTLRSGADLTYINGYIFTPRGVNTNTFYRYEIATNTWTTRTNVPITLNDDIDTTTDGTDLYVSRQQNTTSFYRYNVASNTWDTLTSSPYAAQYAGVQYFSGDGHIYFFRGINDYRFWKYDIANNVFAGPAEAPATLSTGSNWVYYNGEFYIHRGSNTTTYYKYNPATNAWSTLATSPTSFNDDLKGVAAGSLIYYFNANNSTAFYSYEPLTDTWTTLTPAPLSTRYGPGLAYPGTGDYIYATRGQNTTTFWRYQISTNQWQTILDDLPGTPTIATPPTGANAYYGSRLSANSTDVFYLTGNGIKRFFKYTIATNTWTELAIPPFTPFLGTDMVLQGDVIVALSGYYKSDVYEYHISDNTWRKLPSLPSYGPTELGTYSGAGISYDPLSNQYFASYGNARLEIFAFSPGLTNFPSTGTWTSAPLDFIHVASWQSFSSSTQTPDDSTVTFASRSSADGDSWSSWQAISGSTIASPPNRFFQVRATLNASTGSLESPSIQSITVETVGDTSAPVNPNSVSAYSQAVGGLELISGESYKHLTPYFTWQEATDTESEIAGYYVYFGPNNSANPVDNGIFTSGTTFQSNHALTTGTYFFRIASKNTAEQISSPETLFVYDYSGVAPALSTSASDSADFTGTATSVATTNDELKLQSLSQGFWQEDRLSLVGTNMQRGGKNAAYDENSGKLYVLVGANNNLFRLYDPVTDTWSALPVAPNTVSYGGGLVEGPAGYLYALRGINTTEFWRYEITDPNTGDGTWSTEVTNAPLTVSYGASMVFDGSQYIYVTRGNGTNTFWRYDTFSDEWNNLEGVDFGVPSTSITNAINRSADLTIDRENGLIYATQGNFNKGFAVYNINTATWQVLPDSPTLPYDGSAIEYDPTTNAVYYTAGYSTTGFYKFDVESQEWSELAETPASMLYGAGIHLIDDSLYAFRGGNTQSFYRYDIATNSWKLPTRGLFGRVYQQVAGGQINVNTGADILKGDGNHFYLTRGGTSDDFVRYNQSTGEIQRLENTPTGVTTGSSLVYVSDQQKIYFTGGANDPRFFWYDIATNSWELESSDPVPAATSIGSSMTYDGSQYIYLNRGNSATLYRFDTLGSAGNKWSTLANAPATLGNGAELVLRDGYLYTLRGANAASNPFYRYTIADNTWTSLTPLSVTVQTDGFLVDGNDGYLYATRGINLADYWRYSITNDSWEELNTVPALVSTGGAGEANGVNKIFMIPGANANNYQDALYTYVMQTNESGFVRSGQYESPAHDFSSVYKWGNLTVDQSTPVNTTLEIQTRSSEDESVWSDWVAVSLPQQTGSTYSYKIHSPPARYLQLRFQLTSGDGIFSPSVSSYTINYYQDDSAPTNPQSVSPALNGFKAYTNASASAMLNYCTFDTCPGEITDPDDWYWKEDWYNHTAPHFTWPEAELPYGASDTATGSGVLGYYVYFGTNPSADPTEGVFQTESSYTATSLSNNSVHYLRIKTVDAAGNESTDVWQPFSYRYDVEGPTAPANVTADPAGYSATPQFAFSWEAASSSGALVSEYCYKTATSSGIFASDQCIAESNVSITDIPPYKVGQNTFSVRAKDEAGNYSAYGTVSYYYADIGNAPAPPSNLQVSPESSTANSFAFSWGLPEAFLGAASNLSYRYSINALPTAQSTSETSLLYLNAGAFATLPGENTFYVVAKDEAGNINYGNYASISFFANTVAPGIPVDMEIADVSVKSTSSWRLAVSWDEPTSAGSGVATYKVFRSTDGTNFSQISTTSGTSYVDTKLQQVTYYYQVNACDNTNNCGEVSSIVSLLPDGRYTEPAELVAEPVVSSITTKKATVTWTTARTADSKIAFGTESGKYSDTEVASSEQVANHVLNLINLSPGTKYYYVAKWTDEDGNLGVSEENSFETLPPPSTQEPKAKQVGLTTALIEFISKNSEKVKIYFGETPTFGGVKELNTGSGEGTHTVELEELKDGTKYFYKINAFDIDGAEYEGEMHSFTTLPRPKVSDISITQVQGTAQTTLLLRWKSNTAVSSIVTYFPTGSPQLAKDEVNIALKDGNHRMILFNLEPQTPYSVIIRGKDVAGNEAASAVQQVLTSADTRPPQILELKVDSEVIGVGEEATVQLLVSFKTDERASSQVEYGEGTGTTYSQKTQEDGTLVLQHLVVISGLSPGKVYHLRALSKDEFSNVGESIDKVVVTPKATESALDLVISNLSSVFSFLQVEQ